MDEGVAKFGALNEGSPTAGPAAHHRIVPATVQSIDGVVSSALSLAGNEMLLCGDDRDGCLHGRRAA